MLVLDYDHYGPYIKLPFFQIQSLQKDKVENQTHDI